MVDFTSTDLGFEPEEVIPGLMAATVAFALMTANPRQALDEAIDMLSEERPSGELAQE